MSFKSSKQKNDPLKPKIITEDYVKNSKREIDSKIFEIKNKCSSLKEKLIYCIDKCQYEEKKIIVDLYEDIQRIIASVDILINEFKNIIEKNEINFDSYLIVQANFKKNLETELLSFNSLTKQYNLFLLNCNKISIHNNEEYDHNDNDEESKALDNKFKIKSSDIKFKETIAENRKTHIEKIHKDSILTKSINEQFKEIIYTSKEKVESIDSHITEVVSDGKETYSNILKASNDDIRAKDNKCCISFLLIIIILFFILFIINRYRS